MTSPNPDSLLGMQLDEYRLEEMLGRGGMARVYRAVDVRLNRYVAIKIIDTPYRGDAEYTRRFAREAQAIARLEHPNIVRLYRYGEIPAQAAGSLFYMAMQYVQGATLAYVLSSYRADGETFPYADAQRIISEMGSALDYIHAQGIIHRDVKPSNILLTGDGSGEETYHAMLTDFGLALLTQVGTRGETFGTPHYIAPEQALSSAKAVPQSDLYALGVILFEMVTGRLPFHAKDPLDVAMQHMQSPPPAPRGIRPEISPELEGVILKALAKRPEDRYQTGRALAAALKRALAAQEPSEPSHLSVPARVNQAAAPSEMAPPLEMAAPVESSQPVDEVAGANAEPETPPVQEPGAEEAAQAGKPVQPEPPPPRFDTLPTIRYGDATPLRKPSGEVIPGKDAPGMASARPDAAREDAAREDAAQKDAAREDAAREDVAQEDAGQKDAGHESTVVETPPVTAREAAEPPMNNTVGEPARVFSAATGAPVEIPAPARTTAPDRNAASPLTAWLRRWGWAAGGVLVVCLLAAACLVGGISLFRSRLLAGSATQPALGPLQRTITAMAQKGTPAGTAAAGASPTNTPAPALPVAGGGYSLLAGRCPDDACLFLKNQGNAPVPLAALEIRNKRSSIQGSAWGVDALPPGACLVAVGDVDEEDRAAQPQGFACDQLAGRALNREGKQRFWQGNFTLLYNGKVIGECKADWGSCGFEIP